MAIDKVLIVEDSAVQAGMYSIIFAKFRSQLFLAENGHKALQILTAEPNIDLVITDINMPEMNGVEFLQIAQKSKLIKCPTIIISTQDNEKLLRGAVSRGIASAFVIKPWNMAKLQELIANLAKIELIAQKPKFPVRR